MMHTHVLRNWRLESGAVLPEVVTAYRTLGALAADGSNAVLVLHGYTTGPDMLDAGASVAEGSWSGLVGPGCAIDTNRFFVVCPNMLGSSYGSTGPGSTNPATGGPYGIDFPDITLADIVAVQQRLLDDLGVRRLALVTGPSMGGYQALQWAVQAPDRVERVAAAVTAPYSPQGDVVTPTLERLARDPAWNAGRYATGALVDTLTRMRIDTLTRYGVDAELSPRIPDPAQRAQEIDRMARAWAERFDPGSLISLGRAAQRFDLRPQLGRIRAPLLMVLSRTDAVFSPTLAREFAPGLDAAGVPWSYVELDSEAGHFASGADAHLWSGVLREFIDTPVAQWRSWGSTPSGAEHLP